jgi:polyribonucleotide nucleotidyltransferase
MKIKKVELNLGEGKVLSLETGRVAKEAGGAVIVRLGDTMVLATATASGSPRQGMDFFPLLVDFEEKLYAAGKIPGGFFKREGRPTETAILTARRVDRPIRPLFAEGFRNDVQIVVTPLSVDHENAPDVLAIIGASAALSISDVPFEYPIGAVRVGKVGEKFIVNPTTPQMEESSLDLVIAGTKDAIMMIEAGAEEVSEGDVFKAIEFGHKTIKDIIKLQEELASSIGQKKRKFELYSPDEKIKKFIADRAEKKIAKALEIKDKNMQKDEIGKIKGEFEEEIKAGKDEELKALLEKRPFDIGNILSKIEKKLVREMILSKGKRLDGRGPDDIRPINCEVGVLPRAHGSAIFSRGETQVLTVTTLGSAGEEQRIEGLEPEEWKKRYMHHYNFPAFSVGEVRPIRGPGRREIGHGALAERGLQPVIPSEDKFPYTIRLVSEVLGSNGSTSMASTCGSTLSLMDAGIPIDSPVAGISIGLITDDKKKVMLKDIQGLEDHVGDMDFKVAGTKKGITAIQVDMKIKGLSFDLIKEALKKAKEAREHILEKMADAIKSPRAEVSQYAPKIATVNIPVEKIGLVIGPQGKMIKKIIEETGVDINIDDDGRCSIASPDAAAIEAAKKRIEDLTFEPKVGSIFLGKVTRLMNFGAFVEIAPGKEGLLHVSQISRERVNKVEDVLKEGDRVLVKLTEIDDRGRRNLSKKAITKEEEDRFNKK